MDAKSPDLYTPKHLAEKILASKSTVEGERKQVTVLFADLKGSMELLADRDPEESRTLLNEVVDRMMEAVHRYEGTVNNVMGDGIMAIFGAPLAHEDHALRACYAALRMQDTVTRYGDEVRRSQGVPVTIRVGLNSGEVVVGNVGNDLRTDYTAVGQTTHLAARMEQMATPGTIVVNANTHKLTEGYFQFKGLGALQVKGVSEAVEAYELQGLGLLRTRLDLSVRRGLLRFVGRKSELEQIRHALDLAKQGHGQIVGVLGEPGVGKSRLCYEFKIIEEPGCLVLEAFSVSHGKAYPYLPLTEFLKDYFQIGSQDDERTRREKVGGKVLMLDRNLEETLPYLFFLLGISEPDTPLQQMDSQIRRQRTFDAIKHLLLRESRNQPLLLLFEDLHWIDGETQAFLDILGDSVASARILLLVNYRPEYRHDWGNKTYYTQLRLDPLGRADARELLDAMLGEHGELLPLKQQILERTEGYPFYMEEVVQTLVEEEALRGDRGNYRLTKISSELHIPPTVQVALAARIDRLLVEDKSLLHAVAVVGRKFTLSLLAEVVETAEDQLHEQLSRLQGGEFIYEQPAFPDVEYIFKHALTQEVAYNSVLSERRKVLHERTGEAIERLYRERLDEHYNELAHHYQRGGNVEKAVNYLKLAGEQSMQRSAHKEAVEHLTAAIGLIKTLPPSRSRNEQELTLQTALGVPLMAVKGQGSNEVGEVYNRARVLCDEVGETRQLFKVLMGLWRFYNLRAEYPTAQALCEQLMALAEKAQNPAFLMEAHRVLGVVLLYRGQCNTALTHLEKAFVLYDPERHRSHAFIYGHDPRVFSLTYTAYDLWLLGFSDQAAATIQRARTAAQGLSLPFSLGLVLSFGMFIYQHTQETEKVKEWVEAALAFADEQGFPVFSAYAIILQGWLSAQDDPGKGLELMHNGLKAYLATGNRLQLPYFLSLIAQQYRKAGLTEKALSTLSEAFEITDKTDGRWYEAELHRLKGEFLLPAQVEGPTSDASSAGQAETCFRLAIDIARRQQARALHLRAAMSLSRLLCQTGNPTDARLTLTEAYEWFTEGFETGDLKDAKALLKELS